MLSKFISESRKTSKKVIASIKDQVNVNTVDEYREMFSNCGCNICTVGEEVEPDRFGRLAANKYCWRVNDRMAALSTKYSSFSSRSLERFYNYTSVTTTQVFNKKMIILLKLYKL